MLLNLFNSDHIFFANDTADATQEKKDQKRSEKDTTLKQPEEKKKKSDQSNSKSAKRDEKAPKIVIDRSLLIICGVTLVLGGAVACLSKMYYSE